MYIGDSAKDLRDKSVIDMGAQQTLSNAQDPRLILDLIKVLKADSASESEAILERSITALEKLTAQNNAQMQQMEKDKMAAEQAKLQNENAERQKDREKDIEVAKIHAGTTKMIADDKLTSSELIENAKMKTDLQKEQMKASKPSSSSNSSSTPKKASSEPKKSDKKKE